MATSGAGVNPRPSGCAREATDLDEKSGPAADTCSGTGVIWNRIAFKSLVIPAKAGTQSVGGAFPKAPRVDSRFRGNDCDSERPVLANDTSGASGAGLLRAGRLKAK